MTGRKTVKARTRKINPLPRKAAKYASWVVEGICRLQRASVCKLCCSVNIYLGDAKMEIFTGGKHWVSESHLRQGSGLPDKWWKTFQNLFH